MRPEFSAPKLIFVPAGLANNNFYCLTIICARRIWAFNRITGCGRTGSTGLFFDFTTAVSA